MTEPDKILKDWKKEAAETDIDLALFWAGRMSIVAGYIISSHSEYLSTYITLLRKVKQLYDKEIFSRPSEEEVNDD